MTKPLDFVFLGLSLSSSWGNGHATTYRALLRALSARGHRVKFFERAVPWYRDNTDLHCPDFCELVLYESLDELASHGEALKRADVVVVGSYVPDGPSVLELVLHEARGVKAFYDIDTPITLAALARHDCDYLSADAIPKLDLYLSFAGGPSLDTLRSSFGARRAEPLYCSVDPRSYFPVAAELSWDLGYLGTYAPDRQPGLENLLLEPARSRTDLSFVVGGSQYPAQLCWPSNVTHLEHVPPDRHREFYCGQRWTLNLTRRDMAKAGYSPSVRLFEAAACGTPIISDRAPGLDTFFIPDREIIVVDGPEQVLSCLTRYSESQRRALAERALARVLKEHTAARRASTLENYVRAAIAQPRAARSTGRPRVERETAT
jgi:spore maturation protein CgeB